MFDAEWYQRIQVGFDEQLLWKDYNCKIGLYQSCLDTLYKYGMVRIMNNLTYDLYLTDSNRHIPTSCYKKEMKFVTYVKYETGLTIEWSIFSIPLYIFTIISCHFWTNINKSIKWTSWCSAYTCPDKVLIKFNLTMCNAFLFKYLLHFSTFSHLYN